MRFWASKPDPRELVTSVSISRPKNNKAAPRRPIAFRRDGTRPSQQVSRAAHQVQMAGPWNGAPPRMIERRRAAARRRKRAERKCPAVSHHMILIGARRALEVLRGWIIRREKTCTPDMPCSATRHRTIPSTTRWLIGAGAPLRIPGNRPKSDVPLGSFPCQNNVEQSTPAITTHEQARPRMASRSSGVQVPGQPQTTSTSSDPLGGSTLNPKSDKRVRFAASLTINR